MILKIRGCTLINKSGRVIAKMKNNQCHVAQKDFRRACRQIRELFGNNIYFVII
jgi:hypothetical protein